MGPENGTPGKRECGGRADHRRDIRINFRITGENRQHDLDFIHEAFREQRADGPVDQARGEGFLFGRSPFALEESARNTACGVEFFEVVNREREERLPGLGLALGNHRGEHHGVPHGDDHCAAGLAGDLARLQRHAMLAPLERLLGYFKHVLFPCACRAVTLPQSLSGAERGSSCRRLNPSGHPRDP
jgi:hypothetical protein